MYTSNTFAALERRVRTLSNGAALDWAEDWDKIMAADTFSVPITDVTRDQIKYTKTLNYYRNYGGILPPLALYTH